MIRGVVNECPEVVGAGHQQAEPIDRAAVLVTGVCGMGRIGHIPLRRCVACGSRRGKGELVRLVRTLEGRICVDFSNTRPGRGAYVCRDPVCWTNNLRPPKIARLRYALRGNIDGTDRDLLTALETSMTRFVSAAHN